MKKVKNKRERKGLKEKPTKGKETNKTISKSNNKNRRVKK